MNIRILWSRILVILGGIAMLVGAIDPLEGSVLILIGSGLALLSAFIGQVAPRLRAYWILTFALVSFGVVAMFLLSAVGGIGGSTGRSMWWGLFILPYPIGWVMGITNLLHRLVTNLRHRHSTAPTDK